MLWGEGGLVFSCHQWLGSAGIQMRWWFIYTKWWLTAVGIKPHGEENVFTTHIQLPYLDSVHWFLTPISSAVTERSWGLSQFSSQSSLRHKETGWTVRTLPPKTCEHASQARTWFDKCMLSNSVCFDGESEETQECETVHLGESVFYGQSRLSHFPSWTEP